MRDPAEERALELGRFIAANNATVELNKAFAGVDNALFNDGAWKSVTTVPATSVYYSDTLTNVTIDGKGYLIDPTWGETDSREPKLAYFLFTDEERKTRDGFNPLKFYVAGAENSRKKYSFEATDETFKPLWNGTYVALDHDARCIYYFDYYGELKRFEYGKTGE